MKLLLPSIFIKVALVLIPLSILKILSSKVSASDFSNFFIIYNISLYVYALLFSLPAISLLRFYHHEPFKALLDFGRSIYFQALLLFTVIFLLSFPLNINLLVLPILILSSGMGYFLFVSNIYRSNQYLISLAIFHLVLLLLIISIFFILSTEVSISILILLTGISYWLVGFVLRTIVAKKHSIRTIKLKSLINTNLLNNKYFKYAFPLAIVGLVNSLMASSNQIILKFYVSDYELAGYIANYVIAEKIFFATQSLIVFIFLPIIYKRFNSLNQKAFIYIRNLSYVYFFIGITLCLFTYFFGELISSLFSSDKYIDFAWIISISGIGLIFLGVASLIVEIYLVSKNSFIVMKIYVVGALSNILINLSLIPIYGLNGAIIGTILSYLIILFIAIYKLKDLKEVSLFNRGLDHKS